MANGEDPRAAFTFKPTGLVRSLETEIQISLPFHPSWIPSAARPPLFKFNAVWDTGATGTVITEKVIKKLGIEKMDETDNYTANGVRKAGIYLVNIYLPHRVAVSGVRVIDGDIFGTDVLIGMDIISQGDFAVTNRDGETWMTFQIPSSHRFDFVKEIETERAMQAKGQQKRPRRRGQLR